LGVSVCRLSGSWVGKTTEEKGKPAADCKCYRRVQKTSTQKGNKPPAREATEWGKKALFERKRKKQKKGKKGSQCPGGRGSNQPSTGAMGGFIFTG